jgi:hypothetical protein
VTRAPPATWQLALSPVATAAGRSHWTTSKGNGGVGTPDPRKGKGGTKRRRAIDEAPYFSRDPRQMWLPLPLPTGNGMGRPSIEGLPEVRQLLLYEDVK